MKQEKPHSKFRVFPLWWRPALSNLWATKTKTNETRGQ
ncbi:MAG: hypothetical protein OJF59_002271 [Cytophagales bacterium]|nr:MAG: hypothetical protein OJF59_002271 [Cytophagales bacterium]